MKHRHFSTTPTPNVTT